jgi:putative phage-type endonuclease
MDDPVYELIVKYGKNDQRTAEWHQKRGEMLTASEIVKACVDATPAMKHEIVMSKLVPRSSEGSGARSLVWGTRFEQIAKDIYCYQNPGLQIVDTTCIPHPDYSFLGASPDGILRHFDPSHSLHNRLIEIKCPISRVLDDSPISSQYMCQMQLQMECARISKCEFVEMKFKELTYTEWIDSKSQYKSFFAVTDAGEVIYKHFNDSRTVPIWRSEIFNEEDDHRIFYWELSQIKQQTVDHNPNWIIKNIESFKSTWDLVLQHRAAGTLPQRPSDAAVLIL